MLEVVVININNIAARHFLTNIAENVQQNLLKMYIFPLTMYIQLIHSYLIYNSSKTHYVRGHDREQLLELVTCHYIHHLTGNRRQEVLHHLNA